MILGPEHAPKTARLIGRWSAKMRSAATSISEAVNGDDSLREIRESIQDARAEIHAASSEIKNIGSSVKQATFDAASDLSEQTKNAFDEAKKTLNLMQSTSGRESLLKPLGRLENPSEVLKEVWLSPPQQVPDEIRRKTQFVIEHFVMPRPSKNLVSIPLEPRNPRAAFCRIRALSMPQNPDKKALKIVKLPPISSP